ncbi:MAG: hypothetical protein WCJ29_01920 [bacterium]
MTVEERLIRARKSADSARAKAESLALEMPIEETRLAAEMNREVVMRIGETIAALKGDDHDRFMAAWHQADAAAAKLIGLNNLMIAAIRKIVERSGASGECV